MPGAAREKAISRLFCYFVWLVAIASLIVLAVKIGAVNTISILFSFAYLFVLPGLTISLIIWPKLDEIPWLARAASSVGLSIVVLPLVIFYSNHLLSIPINRVSVLWEVAVIVFVALLIFLLRSRVLQDLPNMFAKIIHLKMARKAKSSKASAKTLSLLFFFAIAMLLSANVVKAATIVPLPNNNYSMITVDIDDAQYRAKLLLNNSEEVVGKVVICSQYDRSNKLVGQTNLLTDYHGIATCPLNSGVIRVRIEYTPDVYAEETIGKVTNKVIPQASSAALAASAVTAAVVSNASLALSQLGLKDFLLMLSNYFFLLFGMKKKKKFGVVYDASTQKPVSGAVVQLYESPTMRLVAVAMTDKDGAYIFTAKTGKYTLSVIKPGFIFPSRIVTQSGVLEHNYLGQVIEVNENNPAVNFLIPIDPYAGDKIAVRPLYRVMGSRLVRYTLLLSGTAVSCFSLLNYPSVMGYVSVSCFLILWFAEFSILNRTVRYSKVVNNMGFKPIELALVRVVDPDGKLVETFVTDQSGRVLPKISHKDQKIIIEKSGYQTAHFQPRNEGIIERQRFEVLQS